MTVDAKFEVLCPFGPPGPRRSLLAIQRGSRGFRKLVLLRAVDQDLHPRIAAEIRAAASFSHPGVAALYELETHEDQLYLVMAPALGPTLAELLDASVAAARPLPAGVVLRAIRDAAAALHSAHGFTDALGRHRPLLHRALSDRSIAIAFDGLTRVVDLGVPAELTHGAFSAPEAIRGEAVDARADVFSLGAIAHACLTEERYSYAEILSRGPSKAEFPPPSERRQDVPPEFDPLLMRALFPSRERRFDSTLELAREIDRVAGELLATPAEAAALIEELFPERQKQLRAIVDATEERLATAVAPLSGRLYSELRDELGKPGRIEPTMPLMPMPDESASARPGSSFDIEDEGLPPPYDPLARTLVSNDPPFRRSTVPAIEAQRAPRRGRSAVLFAALVSIVIAAASGVYVLGPKRLLSTVFPMRADAGAPEQRVISDPPRERDGGELSPIRAEAQQSLADAGSEAAALPSDAGSVSIAEASKSDPPARKPQGLPKKKKGKRRR